MVCRRRPTHLTCLLLSPLCAAWKRRVFHPAGMRAAYLAHNDPHEEHDFGSFQADGQTIFFKIDYFDKTLMYHSPDPADPSVTERVITILLADEY